LGIVRGKLGATRKKGKVLCKKRKAMTLSKKRGEEKYSPARSLQEPSRISTRDRGFTFFKELKEKKGVRGNSSGKKVQKSNSSKNTGGPLKKRNCNGRRDGL